MRDRCHGSARPESGRHGALNRDPNRDFHPRTPCRRSVLARLRAARRQWIIDTGCVPASTPMWNSRTSWLIELDGWLASDHGQQACASAHIRPALVVRVSEVLATHADHRSGRHCAVTNAATASSAKCSPRTVTTVRRLLADAELAIEIRRGTGSARTPQHHRRPSVWHLVSRRRPVDNAAVCDLPPSRRDRRVTPVGKSSPSGRQAGRQRETSPKRKPPQRDRQPRPIQTQRLAAAVIAASIGLGHVHTGHICDALSRSGLNLETWTAPAIIAALNADMNASGRSWPDRITRPGAFLASRLRRLPTTPLNSGLTARPSRMSSAAHEPDSTPRSSAAARMAARAYFQQHRAPSILQRPAPVPPSEPSRAVIAAAKAYFQQHRTRSTTRTAMDSRKDA